MTISTLSPTHASITHSLLTTFLSYAPCPGERPLKKSRIAYLRDRLDKNLFHDPTWAIAHLPTDPSSPYRVNGQHSATMLLAAIDDGIPISHLHTHILNFSVSSTAEVSTLFSQFDAAKSARSPGDIVRAHAALIPSLSSIQPTALKVALAGIAWTHNNALRKPPSFTPYVGIDSVIESFLNDPLHQEFIAYSIKLCTCRRTRTTGALAAAYYTWLRSRPHAENFWTQVVCESHPDPSHPTRTLSSHFRDLSSPLRRDVRGITLTRRLYAVGINAWNAYCKSRTPSTLRYTQKAALPRPLLPPASLLP